MDLRRLRVGEWVLALSSAALLVSLFLPWYERGDTTVSGWESFTIIDVLLAAVAIFALCAVVATATQPTTALSISFESLSVIFGLVASVLALVRVLDVPDFGGAGWARRQAHTSAWRARWGWPAARWWPSATSASARPASTPT